MEEVSPQVEASVVMQPSVLAGNDAFSETRAPSQSPNLINTGNETTDLDSSSVNECGPFRYENTTAEEESQTNAVGADTTSVAVPVVCETVGSRRSDRNRRKPEWLKDYVED